MFLLGFITGSLFTLLAFRRWIAREVEPPRRDPGRGLQVQGGGDR